MLGFWAVIGILLGVWLFPVLTLGIVLCAFGAPVMGWILIIWSIIVGIIKLLDS